LLGMVRRITLCTMKHKSTTMTLRLSTRTKRRLERLADSTDRTPSYLAVDALESYLDLQDWQVEAIRAGVKEADEGRLIRHSDIASWVRGWGSKKP
jgi:RHH-type transcriptional regulator, rel operon repressor / antitoxin RelB